MRVGVLVVVVLFLFIVRVGVGREGRSRSGGVERGGVGAVRLGGRENLV